VSPEKLQEIAESADWPYADRKEGDVWRAALVQAVADLGRLRRLVAEVEEKVDGCPWCGGCLTGSNEEPWGLGQRPRGLNHATDCPAFSATGVVR